MRALLTAFALTLVSLGGYVTGFDHGRVAGYEEFHRAHDKVCAEGRN